MAARRRHSGDPPARPLGPRGVGDGNQGGRAGGGSRGLTVAAPRRAQAALKKYQTEQRSRGDALDKCQAELKKLRKKSQGSKNPQKYSDKELQVGPALRALGGALSGQVSGVGAPRPGAGGAAGVARGPALSGSLSGAPEGAPPKERRSKRLPRPAPRLPP